MSFRPDGDASLHAFVDGESDHVEREAIFAAIAADKDVERRLCDIRRVKSLVRHAYADVASPVARTRHAATGRYVAVAAALFALGLATGWILFSRGGTEAQKVAHGQQLLHDSRPAPGVVIQVADGDPAKWRLAIDQAKAVLDPEWNPGAFDVVVVAYGPALGMLREGSPVRAAVHESLGHGIRFVACGNTMESFHIAGSQLLPGVAIAKAGAALEILALERAGYAYVRI